MATSAKKKRKRRYGLLKAVSCITLLAALVLIIHVFTGMLDQILPGRQSSSIAASQTSAGGSVSAARGVFVSPSALTSSLPAISFSGSIPGQSGSSGATPDSGTGTQPATEGDASGPLPISTSHTMTNTPIDLASLDTSPEGWGPGTDCDQQNRPRSALSYQEKYSKYNANFIVPDSNKIYLTFDEGYENGRTSDILDVLKEKNVQTVFFVTSPYVKQNPDLIQRMIDEGHTVGAHSVTHPADGLPSQTVEQQQREITELHAYVKENFNYEMHLFRFPAGIFSEQSLAIVNNCNYKSVFWSFAYLDYDTENQPEPAQALEKLKSRLHPGAIYLLHAVSSTNASILGEFIDSIQEEGYEIGMFD